MTLLTSAQGSAEVRALQRALSFYLYFYLSGYVCGLCFTDCRPVAFSCKQRLIDAPDKAIKQSRDLKYVLFLLISDLGIISYCAASCAGLQNQKEFY